MRHRPLSGNGPIDCANPVDRSHWANRNLSAWFLTLPGLAGRAQWHDLAAIPARGGDVHATFVNGAVARGTTRPGGFGHAEFVSASSQSASAPNRTEFDFSSSAGDWCSGGWLYRNSGGVFGLWGKPSGGLGDEWGLFANNANFDARVFNATDGFKSASKFGLPSLAWTWLYVEWDAAAKVLSVDIDNSGTSATVSVPNGLSSRNIPFLISHNASGFSYLDGKLDDIRLYRGRRLALDERRALRALSLAGYPGALNRFGPATFLFGPPTIALASSDSASSSDSSSLAASLAGSDSGSSGESAALAAALADSDSGTGAETAVLTASLTTVDSAASTEVGSTLAALAGSDSGTGAELAALGVELTGSDSGSAGETVTLLASLSAADAGAIAEAWAIVIPPLLSGPTTDPWAALIEPDTDWPDSSRATIEDA